MPNTFTKTSQSEEADATMHPLKTQSSVKSFLTSAGTNQQVLLIIFLLLMTVAFSLANPRFLSLASFGNIVQDWAPAALLAAGQTYVIITAGVDLSVGSIMGLSAVSAGMMARSLNAAEYNPTATILISIAAALIVGIVCGIINGVLIAYVKLAPFIATLATMSVGAGLTLVTTNGIQVGGGPREVSKLGSTAMLSIITVPVAVSIVAIGFAALALKYTRFGRWTYAIGSNRFSADAAGINVRHHLVKVYLISGMFAALAGLFVYFRLGAGSPTTGKTMELTSIAAVIVGGTSLFGGRGTMFGSILGAFLVTSVISGLILAGVQPNWQQIVIGVLITVSVVMQQFTGKKEST